MKAAFWCDSCAVLVSHVPVVLLPATSIAAGPALLYRNVTVNSGLILLYGTVPCSTAEPV